LYPTSNLEDRTPVLMSPTDRVAQLYPQAPVSPFVAFCDSQGYGGTSRPYTGINIYGDIKPSTVTSVTNLLTLDGLYYLFLY
jgi:hypothetical protein